MLLATKIMPGVLDDFQMATTSSCSVSTRGVLLGGVENAIDYFVVAGMSCTRERVEDVVFPAQRADLHHLFEPKKRGAPARRLDRVPQIAICRCERFVIRGSMNPRGMRNASFVQRRDSFGGMTVLRGLRPLFVNNPYATQSFSIEPIRRISQQISIGVGQRVHRRKALLREPDPHPPQRRHELAISGRGPDARWPVHANFFAAKPWTHFTFFITISPGYIALGASAGRRLHSTIVASTSADCIVYSRFTTVAGPCAQCLRDVLHGTPAHLQIFIHNSPPLPSCAPNCSTVHSSTTDDYDSTRETSPLQNRNAQRGCESPRIGPECRLDGPRRARSYGCASDRAISAPAPLVSGSARGPAQASRYSRNSICSDSNQVQTQFLFIVGFFEWRNLQAITQRLVVSTTRVQARCSSAQPNSSGIHSLWFNV